VLRLLTWLCMTEYPENELSAMRISRSYLENDKNEWEFRVFDLILRQFLCQLWCCCWFQMQENLDREKKVRADVEKVKRKLETDLKATQEAVEELDRIKKDLEDTVRRSAPALPRVSE